MEIHPNCLPDEMINITGYVGKDFHILELVVLLMAAALLCTSDLVGY
jgi:hypothetical protein